MVAQNKTLRPTQSPSNRTAKQSDSTADAIGPFLKASYLNATLPANIPFRASKLDSPTMTAIQGTGPNLQVAIVAAKGVYSREHILDFISSQNTQIAVFDRMGIKFNPIPTQVKPKPESHLAVADLYAGQYINGDRIAVLVSPRLDKNGMYMVVIASPANQFAEKAKDLLSIYQSMIALPLNR